ncbi:MAG: tetratricopeptide repeat protein [Syntrophobacteraceae bacterium]
MSFPAVRAQESVKETVARIEEAAEICRSILARTPDNPTYLGLMGVIECKAGRPAQAEKWFSKALAIMPDSPETLCSFALAIIMQKHFQRAIPLLKRATEIKADFAPALEHLANAYKECGNLVEAARVYERLLALRPEDVQILYKLAIVSKDLGNLGAARNYCERAVNREPSNPYCINNLGILCYMMADYNGALNCYRRALEFKPDYPEALSNMSILMQEMGAFDKALDFSARALTLRPDYPEALNNLGISLKDTGRLEKSIEVLRRAAALNQADPEIAYNLSLALLAAGNFEEGWRLHEARWKTRFLKDAYRKYPQPVFNGEGRQGQVLFIYQEQGFGDSLQFCRYASMAAAMGFRVVLEVQYPLVRLMKSLEGIEAVIASPEEAGDFDCHCPMMSLPLAMGAKFETIPDRVPYLRADEKEIFKWAGRLVPMSGQKPRVGLVWAGSARRHLPSLAMTDRRRSISPNMLAPLLQNKNIAFFSLQKEGPKAPQAFGLIELMEECEDFADTAALISNIDLVITVDTAIAHLAGALGKPVWVMNRFDSCWRWQRQSDKTPWYPTMKLFHQPEAGDWESVVRRIAYELARMFPRSSNQLIV